LVVPDFIDPVSRKTSVKMGRVGGISLTRKARSLASWVFIG